MSSQQKSADICLFFDLVNDKRITYPMTLPQLPKLEKLNPTLSFTIISYEDQEKADYNGGINEYQIDQTTANKRKKDVYKEIRENSALLYIPRSKKKIMWTCY